MKLSKLILILIVTLFYNNEVLSQEEKRARKRPFGYGSFHFSLGAHFDDMPNLNKALKAEGLPTTPDIIPSIGVGGYRAFNNRWILGAEIHYGLGTSNSATHDMLTHRAGHLLYFGYNVFQTRIVKLYPLIGWTGHMMVITMYENNQPDTDFSNFTSDPKNAGTLYNRAGAFNLSVGADIKMRKSDRSTVLGVRFGYEFTSTSRWKTWSANIVNSPKDKVGGFYLKLNVGFINHDSFERGTKKIRNSRSD